MGTWRALYGYGGQLLNDAGKAADAGAQAAGDMLTTTGKMILKKAGVDPVDPTVGQLQTVENALGKSGAKAIGYAPPGEGETAAGNVVTAAQSDIPVTTGQITGDPYQLALEDRLRKAAGAASTTMADFGNQQTQAVTDRAAALIPGSQPGVSPPSEAELGETLKSQLLARLAALKQTTSDAYAKLPYLTKGGMAANGPSAAFDPQRGAGRLWAR